jgi:hypothetical protein
MNAEGEASYIVVVDLDSSTAIAGFPSLTTAKKKKKKKKMKKIKKSEFSKEEDVSDDLSDHEEGEFEGLSVYRWGMIEGKYSIQSS